MAETGPDFDRVASGAEAEQTQIGQVVQKLLDAFDGMDLPEPIQDMKLIIMADTDREGVCAGSGSYGGDAKEVAATAMLHTKVLLSTMGISMEVIGADELEKLMNANGTA